MSVSVVSSPTSGCTGPYLTTVGPVSLIRYTARVTMNEFRIFILSCLMSMPVLASQSLEKRLATASRQDLDAAVAEISNLNEKQKQQLLPVVIERYKKGDDWRILVAFEHLGPIAKPAAPLLMPLLKSYSLNDNTYGGKALGAIGFTSKEDLRSLIENLKSPLPGARWYSAYVLGKWGKSADQATLELVRVLTDEDWRVRRSAAEALGNLSPSEISITGLIGVLQNHQSSAQKEAAISLGNMGPSAKAAIPVIEQVIQYSGGAEGAESEFFEALRKIKNQK